MANTKEEMLSIESLLHTSGSLNRCVSFKYGNEVRLVEPYSFRDGRDGETLVYAHDLTRDALRAFKLSEMRDVQMEPISYKPRWEVELGEKV